ncbi:SSI family serine proteinase inhibitor [Streptomyces pactum]|uniref:SSI family serine proteinase inhibitor n=1 Tax=Streptomyces pactum TaxID=68249 RepID=UPI0036F4F572
MPLRRLVLATAVTAAAMASVPAAATPLPDPLPARYAPDAAAHSRPTTAPGGPATTDQLTTAGRPTTTDHLVVTVSGTGIRAHDGTYTVDCHPSGGTHTAAGAACDRLDEVARWGRDPFAPVPRGTHCTMQYGGPATARVVGVWSGRPVSARFSRADGCEIARWNRLVPLLPATHA